MEGVKKGYIMVICLILLGTLLVSFTYAGPKRTYRGEDMGQIDRLAGEKPERPDIVRKELPEAGNGSESKEPLEGLGVERVSDIDKMPAIVLTKPAMDIETDKDYGVKEDLGEKESTNWYEMKEDLGEKVSPKIPENEVVIISSDHIPLGGAYHMKK